jgi:ferredoxin
MQEVEIHFGEGREGIVPVGTYLVDAAKRMGAIDQADCDADTGHLCKIHVTEGAELLSDPLKEETDQLTATERKANFRLACYAKIEKPGVITAMVEKKKENSTKEKEQEDREQAYRKEFTELPLEKKIANLMQLEAIALGETFAFVVNSPFKVFEKIGDVMAEFGFKKEEDQKRRARPAEAANGDEPKSEESGSAESNKGGTSKKS